MQFLWLTLSIAHASALAPHASTGQGPVEQPLDLRPLEIAVESASAEFGVPSELLLALAWEASRWDASVVRQWGGYGLFDFREPDIGGGPNIEDAAVALGISPDDIRHSTLHQVRAAAILLRNSAAIGHGGAAPPADELSAWVSAVARFSERHEPSLQDLFVQYVFSTIAEGVARDGLVLSPQYIDFPTRRALPPPPTACDYSGCYQFVNASTSNYTNASRVASDIDYVVIHTVQGSYSGCISWFQNSSASVSAHYVVRSSDGQVTQMVQEQDVAWHAGNWDYNLASVGIEHEGYVDAPSTWYTSAMYAGSAALTADIVARNGISASRSTIIAHSEVPGATHTDPGSGWDWDLYMDLITGGSVTGELTGVVAISDIYSGERLPGASVWIAETGDESVVDADGYYFFGDLPLDSYTVWASQPGYVDGSCTKTISSGTNWCSIALEPDPDWEPGDTGDVPVDSGTSVDDPREDIQRDENEASPSLTWTGGTSPGTAHGLDTLDGGCATVSSGSAARWWGGLVVLCGLVCRRRFSA